MACAQASLVLNKVERALLSSSCPARSLSTHSLLPTQRNPMGAKLLPVLRHCIRANAQPDTTSTALQQKESQKSLPPLQQESQKPSASLANFVDYWDPFSISTRSLRQMMSAMDRIFGELSPPTLDFAYLRAPWDVTEDEHSYQMRIDLPGYEKDEVKVHVDDGMLVLNAQHNKESSDQQNKRSARTRGSYRAKFGLPKNIEAEKVVAKLNNGVLEIHLPKSKSDKQVIDVKIE